MCWAAYKYYRYTIRIKFDGSIVHPIPIPVPRVFAPVPVIRTMGVGTSGIPPRRIPSTIIGSANMPTYIYRPIPPPRNCIKANKVQCKYIPATRPNVTNSITRQTLPY